MRPSRYMDNSKIEFSVLSYVRFHLIGVFLERTIWSKSLYLYERTLFYPWRGHLTKLIIEYL